MALALVRATPDIWYLYVHILSLTTIRRELNNVQKNKPVIIML